MSIHDCSHLLTYYIICAQADDINISENDDLHDVDSVPDPGDVIANDRDVQDLEFDLEPTVDARCDMESILIAGKRAKPEDSTAQLGPFKTWSEFALAQFADETGLSRRNCRWLLDLIHVRLLCNLYQSRSLIIDFLCT
jgi:hypothetical protein